LQELEMEGDTRPHFVAGLAYSNEPPAHSATDLVHNALQAAGHASRDETPLVIFDESLRLAADAQADVDEQMVQLIDRALEEEGWFVPLYQPVVSLHGNSREHYVVYLRLKNETGELMQPEAFLPDAEKAARLSDIDRWIIRRAIQELARHREEGQRINFFLNLSSAAINDDSLLLWICDCLREFKAKGSWLTFVAAQHDVMRNLDAMEQLTEGLKKINCRIALSHFSFEQEAVNLAKHLSVDVVYFSTDTAANISRDKEHRELLQSYNEQLQKEGVKTVVTHIEEAAQLALLWNIGVDYIQGNFIQEPVDSIVYDTEL
jgi:EAL domain-containing protein (putative c-di-GMP-specific phosphodiesterase class I)